MPTAKRGRAEIDITAAPRVVYELITDVTRMGEWSPECYRGEWLDGAVSAAPGVRFRGYNRVGRVRWQTTAVVKRATPGEVFAFTVVHDAKGTDETEWVYEFHRTETGVRVVESFQFLWCPVGNRVTELFIPRGRQVNRGIEQTLQRLKTAAEALPVDA